MQFETDELHIFLKKLNKKFTNLIEISCNYA